MSIHMRPIRPRSYTALALMVLACLALTSNGMGQETNTPTVQSPASGKTLMDYFLPMPLHGHLSRDAWGAAKVLPRDAQNGLEEASRLIASMASISTNRLSRADSRFTVRRLMSIKDR